MQARSIRALLLANAAEYIEFYTLLRKQEIALQLALKDTHLAVMREMGITLWWVPVVGVCGGCLWWVQGWHVTK